MSEVVVNSEGGGPERVAIKFEMLYHSIVPLIDLYNPSKCSGQLCTLGVISHFNIPRKTGSRASHKYCCTFSVTDPSLSVEQYVTVNWFFNDLENHITNFRVGDIIFLNNFVRQSHKDIPQLAGNYDKQSLVIFHSKQDYTKGFQLIEPDVLSFVDNYTKKIRRGQKNIFLLSSDKWDILNTGKRTVPRDTFAAALSLSVFYLYKWGEYLLSTASFNDALVGGGFPLHKVMTQLSFNNNNNHYYESIQPKSLLNAHDLPSPIRCDLVCLVIHRLLPVNDQQSTRLIVWDGTTNGEFRLNYDHFSPQMTAQEAIQQVYPYITPIQPVFHTHEVAWDSNLTDITFHTYATTPSTTDQPLFEPNDVTNFIQHSKQLFGLPIIISGLDDMHNHYLNRFCPGTWVRMRNVYLDVPTLYVPHSSNTPNFYYAVVKHDTSIVALQPFHRDVKQVIQSYQHRVQTMLTLEHEKQQEQQRPQLQRQQGQQQQQPPQQSVVPVSRESVAESDDTPSTSNEVPTNLRKRSLDDQQQSNTTMAAAATQKSRKDTNSQGHPYTPLALVVATPAPAIFSCFGKIIGWFPRRISDFVKVNQQHVTDLDSHTLADSTQVDMTTPSASTYHFLFSLRITDGTYTTDVIVQNEEAEKFLQISAESFAHNEHQEQDHVLHALEVAMEQEYEIDFYLKLYTVSQKMQPSGGDPHHTTPRIAKRLAIYDSSLSI